ncbi:DM13 domain-containing protein [Tsukamurella ocularis]|uniref:DM13 domain-containing protein n=1 Tax=Tsukamurella ocularis TaxID=1970234 RepID=UPI00216971FC|nr:DM13 domain-containing protein [Tsukamurella ocularis]MCS3779904.1 ABC-type oligopeptide transport system substrate-binding subunit [Tsukamurella ocularis]MCS3788696.1 ABC-type oligopeptide transport system substrate-binding subunit [Tsukamurella ocularis]MCS3849906.1 ABC-type oligopeptide transport system substrate-binding subunit [Tsukamurella ocularis]
MRASHLTGAVAAVVLGLALTACGGSKDMSAEPVTSTAAPMPMSMPMSAPSTAATTGMFAGLNGKNVAGTATITGDAVELADFSSDEGPDLHVYLTKGTTEADVKGGVRLGAVTYDKAAQRFTIPAGVASAEYTHLVVHCDKALAVFGAAQLGR